MSSSSSSSPSWSSSEDALYDDSDPKKEFHARKIFQEMLKREGLDPTYAKNIDQPQQYSYLKISLIIFLIFLIGFVKFEYEFMYVVAVIFVANMGDKDAQHILGQRYYLGKGTERNKTLAFYWLKEAAKQGHWQASYNLGVAHIQGFHRLERKGEAHELIKHAARVGVKEAEDVLRTACAKGECDR